MQTKEHSLCFTGHRSEKLPRTEEGMESLKLKLWEEIDKAIENGMIDEIKSFYQEETQRTHFQRILGGTIMELSEPQILSSGYVVDTLEAAIWCFLTTDTYTDCVLKAVNLGDDGYKLSRKARTRLASSWPT